MAEALQCSAPALLKMRALHNLNELLKVSTCLTWVSNNYICGCMPDPGICFMPNPARGEYTVA